MGSLTRSRALGAVSALALGLPSLYQSASAAPKGDAADDVATLNAQLSLARAAAKAYDDAAATNALSAPVLAVAKQFGSDHQAHVGAIVAAITQAGGTASTTPGPSADIASLKTEADLLAALYTLERTTAAAYLADLGDLKSRDLARGTGAMLGVVTTHVALFAEALRRGAAYPTGFVTA